jgi:hypothetical protein
MIRAIIVAVSLFAATFAYAVPSEDQAPACIAASEVEAAVVGAQGATAEYTVSGEALTRFLERLKDIPLPQEFWTAIEGVDRVVGYGKDGFPNIKVFYIKKDCVVSGAFSDRATMNGLTEPPAGEKSI